MGSQVSNLRFLGFVQPMAYWHSKKHLKLSIGEAESNSNRARLCDLNNRNELKLEPSPGSVLDSTKTI